MRLFCCWLTLFSYGHPPAHTTFWSNDPFYPADARGAVMATAPPPSFVF
jgi:hypothetical protein